MGDKILRVLFLTDVNGVYSKNPEEEALLFSTLPLNEQGKLVFDKEDQENQCGSTGVSTEEKEGNNKDDVTGGMELKLSTAINIVTSTKGRVPVFVCNVLKESSQVAA